MFSNEIKTVDFVNAINQYNLLQLCQLTIDILFHLCPSWQSEIKGRYIKYWDMVVGLRHKIDKNILCEYIQFIKHHSDLWGQKDQVSNPEILELWVALIDKDYELSTITLSCKATKILLATFSLMCGVEQMSRNDFIESLLHVRSIFDNETDFYDFLVQCGWNLKESRPNILE